MTTDNVDEYDDELEAFKKYVCMCVCVGIVHYSFALVSFPDLPTRSRENVWHGSKVFLVVLSRQS